MENIRMAGLLIGLLSVVLGCGRFHAIDCSGADIRGTITNIHRVDAQKGEKGFIGSIRIEGVREEDTKFCKASVIITDKTRIFEQKGRDRYRVTFETLKIGQKVEARFTGPVAQSYPVQANALEIVILK
ncbi:MAG: DUF3221 domain-containing protein [Proteobacteria bacterium]|nr:DUF3221 domain-containing protein [Pseudomonadota bacterium]